MSKTPKNETLEEWQKRTGKQPKAMPKGPQQPLGKRFKWSDVGKGKSQ